MNCLEARRRILTGAADARRVMADHLAGCAPCTDFVGRVGWLDEEVARALAIAPPAGLPQRILEATLRPFRRRRFLAAAASFAAAATLGAVLSLEVDDPMALAGIDFVVEEEANAILAANAADPEALATALRALHIALPGQLGDLRYIGTCPFRGGIAHHLIATTPLGKVTLLLLPHAPVDEAGSARARGLRALVRPAGRGSIAMIGESKRSLERVCAMLLRT